MKANKIALFEPAVPYEENTLFKTLTKALVKGYKVVAIIPNANKMAIKNKNLTALDISVKNLEAIHNELRDCSIVIKLNGTDTDANAGKKVSPAKEIDQHTRNKQLIITNGEPDITSNYITKIIPLLFGKVEAESRRPEPFAEHNK